MGSPAPKIIHLMSKIMSKLFTQSIVDHLINDFREGMIRIANRENLTTRQMHHLF